MQAYNHACRQPTGLVPCLARQAFSNDTQKLQTSHINFALIKHRRYIDPEIFKARLHVSCVQGGQTGRQPRASKAGGHPKSEITETKML